MHIRPKRILSLLLAMTLLLGLLPAAVFAAGTPSTLYLTPNENWKADSARFAAYFFGNGETWVSMTDSDGDGVYEAAVPSGYPSVIFCRMNPSSSANSWDSKWNQTADLTVPTNGNNHYTVASGTWDKGGGSWSVYQPQTGDYATELYLIPNSNWRADNARFAAYFFGNGETWVSMTDSDGDGMYRVDVPAGYTQVIFCRMDPNSSVNSWDAKWNQTADLAVPRNDSICYAVAEDTWDNGGGLWAAPYRDCQITLHFADSYTWSNIYLYTWIGADNQLGSWPGTQAGLDEEGFYSVSFQAQIPWGQSLNFIVNNGGNGVQTVDLSIPYADMESGAVERWIQPTTELEDEDTSTAKYYCDIMDCADATVQSPVVNGSDVTFEYKNSGASSVRLFGSMNDWSSGYSMKKNAYGVWSVTLTDLAPGIYNYKFLADGSWISDPVNPWIMTADRNSAFIILDPQAQDKNEVTVKLHYSRPDRDYSGWNAWIWTLNSIAGQYELTEEDGHMTATVTVPGRSTRYVSYIMRYSTDANQWEQQEFGERRVDLSDIVSGTVHCYIDSGNYTAVRVLDTDVVQANKIAYTSFDYEAGNRINVTTTRTLTDPEAQLSISGSDMVIDSITTLGSTYTLTLNRSLELSQLYRYKLLFDGYEYGIGYTSAYATDRFASEFTYEGNDLGASWSEQATTFRVWAPTAADVKVNLYRSGTAGTDDLLRTVPMARDVNGTWLVTVDGDLNGTYYTYAVNVDGETVEACDPYARTTGVNGKRAMVIDLASTDPEGWENDTNPNPSVNYTDAVIYELHVRDFSIDDSSGIIEDYQGKFLAFTQQGSTVPGTGIATGIDYLKNLGITHLHLLPVYDYGSVDETACDSFNWGYDPVNYNTPEGSYSTNPYKGEVRVSEFKQMVKALHEAGISVVMDVVYNHVYDADQYCMNQIVPGYFSRQNPDGSYSGSSGCGNDTASEREMVRKFIVDSVQYWTEEYHIDGFRFDLVGLIDVDTINLLIEKVHQTRPDVIFYGEGWTMGGAVEPGTVMATQSNAVYTPEMAYFNDRIRDAMGGYNGTATGFVSGASGKADALVSNFRAITDYTTDPQQLIQYISCHDNHTLMAKLLLSTGKSGIDTEAVKMNTLAAAIYLTAQGIPFIHAGEEMLRLKIDPNGSFNENSYHASDAVNAIRWDKLQTEMYADTSDYYKGLIAFRKSHPALRYATSQEIARNVTAETVSDTLLSFRITGTAAGDLAQSIYVIFNAGKSAVRVSLPSGTWSVCVDGKTAGTQTLYTASGSVSVAGISAMILVQNEAQAVAQVNGVKYATVQAAVNAANRNTVKLLADSAETVSVTGDLCLDLAGRDLGKVTVADGYCLTLIDTATDDYKGAYGSVTVSGTVNTFAQLQGRNYLAVGNDDLYSAHCYDVALTHISLDPKNDALGYKAELYGDETVQKYVTDFGFHLWVDGGSVKTYSKAGTQSLTLRLKNILASGGGEMGIHANAFVTLTVGEETCTKTCGDQATSMKQTLQAVDAAWETAGYTDTQKAAVVALCKQYREITSDWELDNIFAVIDIPIE